MEVGVGGVVGGVGLTPLEWAIYKGKVEAMKLLLEAGVPIEVTQTQTFTLTQTLTLILTLTLTLFLTLTLTLT